MSTETYPIGVALSVASGKMLCPFPDMHEAITDLAGWPVMTHHLANQKLADGCAEKVIRQVSWMPGAIENMPTWSALPREDVEPAIKKWLGRLADAHGATVTIELGEPVSEMAPLDGLERLGAARR